MKQLLIAGLLMMAGTAQANLVDNWQFTNEEGARTFAGWTITHGAPIILGINASQGYFHGGRNNAYSKIEQTISLAEAGVYLYGVDNGGYDYNLSGWFDSHAGKDDARLRAFFYDDAGRSVGTRTLGWYQFSSWAYRDVMGTLPALTRNVKIILESSRDYGSDNNGYIHTPSFALSVNNTGSNMGLSSIYASDVPVGGILSGFGLLALASLCRKRVAR
jgi:hypothetical protein